MGLEFRCFSEMISHCWAWVVLPSGQSCRLHAPVYVASSFCPSGCVQITPASLEFVSKASPALSSVFIDGLPKVSAQQADRLRALFPSIAFCCGETKTTAKGIPLYRRIDVNPKGKGSAKR